MIIYKITNKKNGKVYIGRHCGTSTARWKQHLKAALDNTRPEHLYRAMNSHGIENFTYEILEEHPYHVGDEFLNEREKFFIKKFQSRSNQNGYNMTDGGEGFSNRYCSTKEKKQISDNLGKFNYGAYSCSTGKLVKIFDKRSDIQKELPQVTHVRHINHACNTNNPFYTGKKYSNGVAYGFMWIKLPNGTNFPEKMEIVPGCLKKTRIVKKRKGDDQEIAQYTLSGQLIKTYPNVVTQIAKEIGTQYFAISKALRGDSTSHMNFIWRRFPKGTSPNNIKGIEGKQIVTFNKNQILNLPIYKKLDGVEVDKFNSALEALLITDMKPTELFKCLNDGTEDSQGFSWSWVP